MNLEKIKITGLFGTFNHTVEFKEGKITLLLGPNGIGKTVILRMIKAFYDNNFLELKEFYFKTFSLYFKDNIEIRISKIQEDNEPNIKIEKNPESKAKQNKKIDKVDSFIPKIIVDKHRHSSRLYSSTSTKRYQNQMHLAFEGEEELDLFISKFIPFLVEKIKPGVWLDMKRARTLSSEQVISSYSEYFPAGFLERFQVPPWLSEITDTKKIRIIESQRLLNRIKSEDKKYQFAVLDFSQEIAEKIKIKKAEAIDLSSKLDRTYPKRLIEKINNLENISNEELNYKLNELESIRLSLINIGLIDSDENYIQSNFDEITQGYIKNVLQLYIQDSNEKLFIYNDLSKKIFLFLHIINQRLNYKTFSIDKQTGFKCKSEIGEDIPLISLSSGEQHELVLFYQLIFNTEPNTLLLIDEPEISLHISWQNEFINDLNKVIDINSMDILIATHSPDIIVNHWDITNQLKGSN